MKKKSQIVSFWRVNIRKYPLSALCWAIIFYLSFFTVPQTELDEVPFIDKWVHTVMYGGTGIIMWGEYLRRHNRIVILRSTILAIIAPIATSGIIELLQEYCSGGRRSGDWLDLAANSLGVILAAIAAYTFYYIKRRH